MDESANARTWLRPELLRSWAEFLLVAALLVAFPIRNSTLGALHGSSGHYIDLLLNNRRMLGSIVVEATALALFLLYLHRRGWRPADFKIGIGWGTSAQAVALLLLGWGAAIVTIMVAMFAAFQLQTAQPTFLSYLMAVTPKIGTGGIHLNWLLMLMAMIVNAYAEELVFMGYIFNNIAARRGPAIALVSTIFLRVACHTYQDPMHLAGIAVLFTIFAVWYWLGRKLWPLILAHTLLDTGSCTLIQVLENLRERMGMEP